MVIWWQNYVNFIGIINLLQKLLYGMRWKWPFKWKLCTILFWEAVQNEACKRDEFGADFGTFDCREAYTDFYVEGNSEINVIFLWRINNISGYFGWESWIFSMNTSIDLKTRIEYEYFRKIYCGGYTLFFFWWHTKNIAETHLSLIFFTRKKLVLICCFWEPWLCQSRQTANVAFVRLFSNNFFNDEIWRRAVRVVHQTCGKEAKGTSRCDFTIFQPVLKATSRRQHERSNSTCE